MDDKHENGRTHEPSLRELTAELDGCKEVLEAKINASIQVSNERDRRYEDRFKAMDEKTSLALTSSEKAVTKAEVATEKRFDAVNEFRGTLNDYQAKLLPRAEADAKFGGYDEKFEDIKKELSALREAKSKGEGAFGGVKGSWGLFVGVIAIVLMLMQILVLMKK